MSRLFRKVLVVLFVVLLFCAAAHVIELRELTGVGPPWSEPQWRQFLEDSQRAGWELAHIEFRHNRFDTDEAGKPQQSYFYFSARLTNVARAERAVLEGDLIVAW